MPLIAYGIIQGDIHSVYSIKLDNYVERLDNYIKSNDKVFFSDLALSLASLCDSSERIPIYFHSHRMLGDGSIEDKLHDHAVNLTPSETDFNNGLIIHYDGKDIIAPEGIITYLNEESLDHLRVSICMTRGFLWRNKIEYSNDIEDLIKSLSGRMRAFQPIGDFIQKWSGDEFYDTYQKLHESAQNKILAFHATTIDKNSDLFALVRVSSEVREVFIMFPDDDE